MEFFLIYLMMVIPNLKVLFAIFGGVTLVVTGILFINYWDDGNDTPTFVKVWFAAALVSIFLSVAIPNKKEMVMIVAGGVTYNVVTSEPAKQLGGKALQLLNNKLDELISDEKEKDK